MFDICIGFSGALLQVVQFTGKLNKEKFKLYLKHKITPACFPNK